MNMNLNSKIINQKAIDLGFNKVGIAKAEPTTKERKKIKYGFRKKKNGSMDWIERLKEKRQIYINFLKMQNL